jgi:hypothetical protein
MGCDLSDSNMFEEKNIQFQHVTIERWQYEKGPVWNCQVGDHPINYANTSSPVLPIEFFFFQKNTYLCLTFVPFNTLHTSNTCTTS